MIKEFIQEFRRVARESRYEKETTSGRIQERNKHYNMPEAHEVRIAAQLH